jgi:hypothetical membrane protein
MKLRVFAVAVIYFISVIIIAHFFTPVGYDWTQNTISDLAAQGHSYKWIMQAGLVGFGSTLILGVVRYFKTYPKSYFLFFVAVYGQFILLSGIYCTAPIDSTIPFSIQESSLHSLFATIAGISMSIGILWQVFAIVNDRERWLRLVFLILIGGLSGLFGLIENGTLLLDKGIVQRVLYLVGLIWLVYEEQKLTPHKELS